MFFELLNPFQKLGRLRLQAVLRLLGDYVGQATPVSPGRASTPFLVSRPTFAAAPRLVYLTSSPGSTRVCISWLTALPFWLTAYLAKIGDCTMGCTLVMICFPASHRACLHAPLVSTSSPSLVAHRSHKRPPVLRWFGSSSLCEGYAALRACSGWLAPDKT